MRALADEAELLEEFAMAQGEARAAFGDPTLYAEKLIVHARHIEVQVLGDGLGSAIHVFERNCSVQRRHQKLIEEAPSPALSRTTAAHLHDAAVRAAQALRYRNAGTLEFLVDPDERFYFLELNGRIQVEHPVTELATGVDLVQEQLRIAGGGRVGPGSDPQAHAIEVRLYAEDPRTFLPQAGRIERLRLPDGIRVDAGVEEGDEVGTAYDPMIAKLIARGTTREETLDRLAEALDETEVGGLVTNLPFLRWLVAHPALREGRTTTRFLEEYPPLSPHPLRLPDRPWRSGWRLNLPRPTAQPPPSLEAAGERGPEGTQSSLTAPMPGTVLRVLVVPGERVEPRQSLVVLEAMKMETPVSSPYAATVRAVHVSEGERVAGGALLVELED